MDEDGMVENWNIGNLEEWKDCLRPSPVEIF